jgi:hypothetical protein
MFMTRDRPAAPGSYANLNSYHSATGPCRSHAALYRAERMRDCLATLAHGVWVCIKTLLHSLEQMLMLPLRSPIEGVRNENEKSD